MSAATADNKPRNPDDPERPVEPPARQETMDSTVTPWRDRAPTGDSADAPLPERIGPYPIEGELGRGGMGIVYLARDPRLERAIAIKLLPESVTSDQQRVARFELEARLLATLNHPHIATIHSLEEADGLHFITMEVIPGGTLADRIAAGPLSIRVTLAVCAQIAWALEAAHQGGASIAISNRATSS